MASSGAGGSVRVLDDIPRLSAHDAIAEPVVAARAPEEVGAMSKASGHGRARAETSKRLLLLLSFVAILIGSGATVAGFANLLSFGTAMIIIVSSGIAGTAAAISYAAVGQEFKQSF